MNQRIMVPWWVVDGRWWWKKSDRMSCDHVISTKKSSLTIKHFKMNIMLLSIFICGPVLNLLVSMKDNRRSFPHKVQIKM